tara:strand:+ start:388 stop:786 length:399 start_codon:yes stop_codon:yes gene_type:complete
MVNNIAVLVAAIGSMVVGMLWYGPLFGQKWVKLMGWNKAEAKKKQEAGKKSLVYAFIGTLVTAYVLAMFIGNLGASGPRAGAIVGFWIWLGFLATSQVGRVLWEGSPKQLYYLNTFFNLVNLAVMGAIIGAF